jgi:FdhE protein
MPNSSWNIRINRAIELSQSQSPASELLQFYQQLARFQELVFEQLPSAEDHDVSVLVPFIAGLISTVERHGSLALKAAAKSLAHTSHEEVLDLLTCIWQHEPENIKFTPEYLLFARALLQPYAEYLASRSSQSEEGSPPICPFCGSKPQVAVLRPEGDGGKRSLICSLCATEWTFRRVKCPNCGEEHKDKLPVFVADNIDYVRVDACDTCHSYIKSVDMTKNGRAVPVVDELATLSLNLWAQEKGYAKFEVNLLGM